MSAMTKSDAMAWVQSLKLGDKVIHEIYPYGCGKCDVLTVKKVTPTGIVRTEQGISFQWCEWRNFVEGIGMSSGRIVPYTDELAEQARVYMQKVEEEESQRIIIRDAKHICHEIAYNKMSMTLELAKAILEVANGNDE